MKRAKNFIINKKEAISLLSACNSHPYTIRPYTFIPYIPITFLILYSV